MQGGEVMFHPACPTCGLYGKSQKWSQNLILKNFLSSEALNSLRWRGLSRHLHLGRNHSKDISIPPSSGSLSNDKNGKRTQSQQWQKPCWGGIGVPWTPWSPPGIGTPFGHALAFSFALLPSNVSPKQKYQLSQDRKKRVSRKRRQAPVSAANHAKLHKTSPTSGVNAK